MSKTLWKKTLIHGTECLVPDCPDALNWLGKTKLNQGVMIEPRRPRNLQHHKKLFALLKIAVDNWPGDEPTTIEGLLGAIKISGGHYDVVQTKKGVWKIPKSINFESMDQKEFEPFYEHAILVISRVLGVPPEDLEREANYFN